MFIETKIIIVRVVDEVEVEVPAIINLENGMYYRPLINEQEKYENTGIFFRNSNEHLEVKKPYKDFFAHLRSKYDIVDLK